MFFGGRRQRLLISGLQVQVLHGAFQHSINNLAAGDHTGGYLPTCDKKLQLVFVSVVDLSSVFVIGL